GCRAGRHGVGRAYGPSPPPRAPQLRASDLHRSAASARQRERQPARRQADPDNKVKRAPVQRATASFRSDASDSDTTSTVTHADTRARTWPRASPTRSELI